MSATLLTICGCGRSGPAARPLLPTEQITDVTLAVTVTCSPGSGDTSKIDGYVGSPSSLHTGTLAVLNETGGHRVRFIDDVRSYPSLSKTPDGHYVFSFNYAPEDRHALAGHEVQELQNLDSVGTRYGGVLDALGIRPRDAKITHLTLTVNGRDLISQDVETPVSRPGPKFDDIQIVQALEKSAG